MNRPATLTRERIQAVADRLSEDRPVRRAMPAWGRIHVDRRLPFIAVYRRSESRPDDGTDRIVVGVASYLLASGDARTAAGTEALLKAVASVMSDAFGAFLIIEVWAGPEEPAEPVGVPRYTVRHYRDEPVPQRQQARADLLEWMEN